MYLTDGVIVALAGAVGTVIKPHFILIALAPGLYWVIAKKRMRPLFAPEIVTFLLAVIGCIALLFVLPAAARSNFFSWLLPAAMKYYDAYNCSIKILIASRLTIVAALMGAALFFVAPRRSSGFWSSTHPLAIVVFAAIFTYVWQQKGWDYQAIPFLTGTSLIIGVVLAYLAGCLGSDAGYAKGFALKLSPKATKLTMLSGLCVLSCLLSILLVGRILEEGDGTLAAKDEVITTHSKKGDPILVISTNLADSYPRLLRMDRRQASRYYFMMPMAGLYKGIEARADGTFPYRAPNSAPPDERRFLQELADDIRNSCPPVILIEASRGQALPKGFSPLDYLKAVGFIDRAMSGYTLLEHVGTLSVFIRSEGSEKTRHPESRDYDDSQE